jgi:hypothetical protein
MSQALNTPMRMLATEHNVTAAADRTRQQADAHNHDLAFPQTKERCF